MTHTRLPLETHLREWLEDPLRGYNIDELRKIIKDSPNAERPRKYRLSVS